MFSQKKKKKSFNSKIYVYQLSKFENETLVPFILSENKFYNERLSWYLYNLYFKKWCIIPWLWEKVAFPYTLDI